MNYINEFLEKHPIYNRITYRSSTYPIPTRIHPLLSASQAIIDSLLSTGKKRIAIVMPDDEINVLPLIVSKYLSNIQEQPEYAHSLFDDIEPGQHLRLGKAVVEFIEFDKEHKTIKLLVGKPTKLSSSITYTAPFSGYHLYFEKSTGALSNVANFTEERKRIKQKLDSEGVADIDLLALKRTVLNKTIVVLSQKKEFKEFLGELFVMGKSFDKVVTYGELDSSSQEGTALFNLGKLDCLPGLVVSPRINEIATADSIKNRIDSVVVTQSKYYEVINNQVGLRKCLLLGIPFIMFVPETEFETFPVLAEMGFEFWNWNESTLKLGGFAYSGYQAPAKSMFHCLSKKVFNATHAKVELKSVKYDELKKTNDVIRSTIRKSYESSTSLSQVTRLLNTLGKAFIDLVSPTFESIWQIVSDRLGEVKELLTTLAPQYEGTEIWNELLTAYNSLNLMLSECEMPKAKALFNVIESSIHKNHIILVPDRYLFVDELQEYLNNSFTEKSITVYRAGEFCQMQISRPVETGCLIVTFFDKSEYIRIKKTYCYRKLTYILYSFENAWRQGFVTMYESCNQRETIKSNAQKIISADATLEDWEPFGSAMAGDDYEIEEIGEFNFERELISTIIRRNNTSSERADSAECIPVVFNQDAIGYFSPNHSLIDITLLCYGDLEKPVKKEASKLRKGDIVLVRQSDRDIIFDKANELMKVKGEFALRSLAELWVSALRHISEGKPLQEVKEMLNKQGAPCDANQVRYWLMGETICPENREVVVALSLLCPSILPASKVEDVLNAGAKVQEYHREAGRWLTSELKYKAKDILSIYQSGKTKGSIDEIGDVLVYVVDLIFDKEYVERSKINRIEVIS